MTKQSLGAVALILAAFAVLLLVETDRTALALGAVLDRSLTSTSAGMDFWYQLSFIRLFAVAVAGLAALCLWAVFQLTPGQQRSLGRVLGAVFALLATVTAMQQVAIWSASAGWAAAGMFGFVAAVLLLGTVVQAPRPAA